MDMNILNTTVRYIEAYWFWIFVVCSVLVGVFTLYKLIVCIVKCVLGVREFNKRNETEKEGRRYFEEHKEELVKDFYESIKVKDKNGGKDCDN